MLAHVILASYLHGDIAVEVEYDFQRGTFLRADGREVVPVPNGAHAAVEAERLRRLKLSRRDGTLSSLCSDAERRLSWENIANGNGDVHRSFEECRERQALGSVAGETVWVIPTGLLSTGWGTSWWLIRWADLSAQERAAVRAALAAQSAGPQGPDDTCPYCGPLRRPTGDGGCPECGGDLIPAALAEKRWADAAQRKKEDEAE
jgi:hypothetical protein